MNKNVIVIEDSKQNINNTNNSVPSRNSIDTSDDNANDNTSNDNDDNIVSLCDEVCIVTTGNVDSGKSTLIGALVTNELDDGNGKLRLEIAKHQHERVSGKTSDISVRTIQKYPGKETILVDLCGHKKYLGTTIFGLTGYFPDYGMLIISANRGMQEMTREHMNLLISLNIPFAVIITREDIAPLRIYNKTLSDVREELKNKKKVMIVNYCQKIMLKAKASEIETCIKEKFSDDNSTQECLINAFRNYYEGHLVLTDKKDITVENRGHLENLFSIFITDYQNICMGKVLRLAGNMKANPFLVPVITVSNKTGYCLDLAKELVHNLKSRKDHWDPIENTVFYIDSCYEKAGVGIIVSGVLRGTEVKEGQVVYLGPYGTKFIKIKIWSIHNNNKEIVKSLGNARRGCFAIRVLEKKLDFKRKDIRKGMVVVADINSLNNLCYEFDADINILHHSTTIKTGFSPSLQLTNSKQAARIVILNKDKLVIGTPPVKNSANNDNDESILYLRTGDNAKVKFRFLYKPEFVKNGDEFVFKEETTRGRGKVTNILSLSDDKKGAIGTKRNSNKQYKTSVKKGEIGTKHSS